MCPVLIRWECMQASLVLPARAQQHSALPLLAEAHAPSRESMALIAAPQYELQYDGYHVCSARYRGYNTNLTRVPDFKLHETDTGSAPVQIARITARIQQLSGHLEQHKKDFATRRGMIMLLGQRRSLLLYLHRQNRCAGRRPHHSFRVLLRRARRILHMYFDPDTAAPPALCRDSYYQIIKDLGIRNVVQADTRGEQKEVF
jgi:ribosomal protein S15